MHKLLIELRAGLDHRIALLAEERLVLAVLVIPPQRLGNKAVHPGGSEFRFPGTHGRGVFAGPPDTRELGSANVPVIVADHHLRTGQQVEDFIVVGRGQLQVIAGVGAPERGLHVVIPVAVIPPGRKVFRGPGTKQARPHAAGFGHRRQVIEIEEPLLVEEIPAVKLHERVLPEIVPCLRMFAPQFRQPGTLGRVHCGFGRLQGILVVAGGEHRRKNVTGPDDFMRNRATPSIPPPRLGDLADSPSTSALTTSPPMTRPSITYSNPLG